jgi:hypothetical protein
VASPYETLSKEEANAFFFGGQPQMAPQQVAPQQTAPVETAPRKTKPIAPPAINQPVAGALDPQGLVGQVTQANKAMQAQTPAPQAPSVVGALIDQLTENWAIPALGLGGAAALGYAGYKMGSSGKEGLKSRDIMNRIDPTMDGTDLSKPTPTAVPVPKEETKNKFAQDFEVKYGVPLATAEEISGGKITKQWEADIVGNAIKNQLPITVKKEAPVITSVTTQPAAMATPVAPTAPDTTKSILLENRPNPYMTPEARVEAPVAPVAPVEKSTEKPASKAKKPVDPSEAGLTKQEIGMKRYLESFYGGGEVGAKTYQQVGEILGYRPAFDPGKGGGLKPAETEVIKGYRKENIEGPKVNLDKDMKRALKGGAGVAALMAIPGFANAAQNKDYAKMVELASDFVVPPFAGSTELGVSTLGEKQLKAFENAQKLGSPYRSVPPR